MKDVLYFPASPVNILSVTKFAGQLGDDNGTGIDTKRFHSVLYWQDSKFKRTIRHPASNLPELPVNEGWSIFSLYSRIVGTKVVLEKQHCHCHASHLIPDDSVDSPAPKPVDLSNDFFHVGETLLFSREGRTVYVRVVRIAVGADSVLRFVMKPSDGDEFETTREFLRAPDDPDIGWIPSTPPEMKHVAAELPENLLEQISNPVKLSPLQEEFLALHERLWHLPFSVMFRMVKLGLLPRKFRKLGNKAPPCVSCMLGQAHKKPWRTKKTKSGSVSSLRDEDLKKPGGVVGVDHLISAQPGLVPQAKGSLTRARIWAATIFIDYATGFVHVGLMSDESGDLTLEAKHNFEHLCATRGIKVKACHADNGRFAGKTFLSDVKRHLQ